MSRWERHASVDGTPSRDYTYSKWHRHALPSHAAMIDIDGLDYCRSCASPLLFVEVARDIGQARKPTTAMKAVAALANVMAICALYQGDDPCTCRPGWTSDDCDHGISVVRYRRVHPDEQLTWTTITGREFRDRLLLVHENHIETVHRMFGIEGGAA